MQRITSYFYFADTLYNISYIIGSNKTVCLEAIEYDSCEHAAMKLSYRSHDSNSSVGVLLYNRLFNPDKVVTLINTTKYGFNNITSERNETNLCLYFIDLSILANGQEYEVHQICEVQKLEKERKHCFIFKSGKWAFFLLNIVMRGLLSNYALVLRYVNTLRFVGPILLA